MYDDAYEDWVATGGPEREAQWRKEQREKELMMKLVFEYQLICLGYKKPTGIGTSERVMLDQKQIRYGTVRISFRPDSPNDVDPNTVGFVIFVDGEDEHTLAEAIFEYYRYRENCKRLLKVVLYLQNSNTCFFKEKAQTIAAALGMELKKEPYTTNPMPGDVSRIGKSIKEIDDSGKFVDKSVYSDFGYKSLIDYSGEDTQNALKNFTKRVLKGDQNEILMIFSLDILKVKLPMHSQFIVLDVSAKRKGAQVSRQVSCKVGKEDFTHEKFVISLPGNYESESVFSIHCSVFDSQGKLEVNKVEIISERTLN